MYIKQVIIEGFKSYREQVATEPFSPKVNCVVGANGSGKTNFFHAIRFVLSDLFNNLRAEDRQALLHEGAGHQVNSAFVELVFDNQDHRIPLGGDEVRLRRTISLKKDEYYLDRKHTTRLEVSNLLESAGFSRSNPYYVVQQGKIASLTLMKDTERLELLKTIGGTSVYEERRTESLKIMQDAEVKRKHILDVAKTIEDRLAELDAEKEELAKYQQLDKQIRSLEYTIFDKELADARHELEKVETSRQKAAEKSAQTVASVEESKGKLKYLEKEIKVLTKAQEESQKLREEAEKQRTEAIRALKNLELEIRDLETQMELENRSEEDINRELKTLEDEVNNHKRQLEDVNTSYADVCDAKISIEKKINECQKQVGLLYQKQGRKSQFKSKGERDKVLRASIAKSQELIAKNKSKVEVFLRNIAQADETLISITAEREAKQKQVDSCNAEISKCQEDCSAAKAKRDELHGQRKELQNGEVEIQRELEQVQKEYNHLEKGLDSIVSKDVRHGIEAVRRLVRDHEITGMHGPIIELIKCEEKFYLAVEVVAGNSLFNIVVETDEVAQKLTRYLIQQKAGRVTFLPLNRIRAPGIKFPNDKDTVPLMKKIVYDAKYKEAVGHIFGRNLICRDLDVATRVARSGDVDCVTMEGDQVYRKGALRGGHHDQRNSRLKLMNAFRAATLSRQQLQERVNGVRAKIQECDQSVTGAMGQMEVAKSKEDNAKSSREVVMAELRDLLHQEQTMRVGKKAKEEAVERIKENSRECQEDIDSKSAEIGTDLTTKLSASEQAELERLNPEVERLQEELSGVKTRHMEIEAGKRSLEEALAQNLVRRQEELRNHLGQINNASRTQELQAKKEQMSIAERSANEAESNKKVTMEKTEKDKKQLADITNEREEVKTTKEMEESALQECAKEEENLMNRRVMFQLKRDDLLRKIRDLGSLPADAFEKYKSKGLKELHKMMHKCMDEVKKYSHVNKAALDQYVSFMEEREKLRKRQEELDEGDQKIQELMSGLDMRKDESIERTFKGVAKNFREAFAELVPNGHGALVMMKKRRAEEAPGDDDEDDEGGADGQGHGGRIEKYIGVKVKVSFTGQGETQSMKQLSGGQKTVVALSLIFAIQRCDPAPFYLFDEIDAALDPQYRTAVGAMIRKQADTQDTQFITTTFRPELVKVADQIYGVFHKSRVSNVSVINNEEALRFIEQDQSHQG